MSKDAFPALPPEAVMRIKAPTLMLSGQRTLDLHKVMIGTLRACCLRMSESSLLAHRMRGGMNTLRSV
jgi:hypothetical protein